MSDQSTDARRGSRLARGTIPGVQYLLALGLLFTVPLITRSAPTTEGYSETSLRDLPLPGLLITGLIAIILFLAGSKKKRDQPEDQPSRKRQTPKWLRFGTVLLLLLSLIQLVTINLFSWGIHALHPALLAFVAVIVNLFADASSKPRIPITTCTAMSFLVTFFTLVPMPPLHMIKLIQQQTGVIFHLPTEGQVVYLTIDDSPTQRTDEILDVLQAYDSTATFFCIGQQIPREGSHKPTIAIKDQNCTIGNHQNSKRIGALLSEKDLVDELEQFEHRFGGERESSWFRPANGFFTPSMLQILREQDYQCVLGDCFPWDRQHGSIDYSARLILQRVRPGSIIILHDAADRGQLTIKTLQTILPTLQQRGYKIRSLPPVEEIPPR